MQNQLSKYLSAFQKLRIDRSHGIAPHKPILLLSILQIFQEDKTTTQRIYITPELVSLFKTNWNLLVISNHECRISYPFYYLKSEKFWKLIPKEGFQNIDKMGSLMKSFSNLNAAIEYAEIDYELFLIMKDKDANIIMQQFLLDEYFPQTRNNFIKSESEQQRLMDGIEGKILNEDAAEYRSEISSLIKQHDEEEIFLRGSLFKREIPKIYNNTCCISGMRIDASINASMIDACHIIPFCESYDDTITNGIALCPNLHRAFDRGLVSIDENYKVIISSCFIENDVDYSIRKFEGINIQLPKLEKYLPKRENLEWHRLNVFKTG